MEKRSTVKTVFQGAGVLAGSALAAAGGWWLYSRLGIEHDADLPPALDAERTEFYTRAAGRLSYYSDAHGDKSSDGKPLVLIHSVNAAASAFEMKPLFELYREKRPVYALELPGFGFSDRTKRDYTPELYAAALLEFLETQVGRAADVVALSLSCEFVARAAFRTPEHFNSLAFVSPTGLNGKREARASDKAGKAGGNDTFYGVASQPLWARAFFDLIATPASIHYFLQGSFVGEVPQNLTDYSYLTSHQPGAEHAPLRFVAGKLFSPNVREHFYERLGVPTLVIYDKDAFVTFERLPELLTTNETVRAVMLKPSRGLPQFEMPERTAEVLGTFWSDPDAYPPKAVHTVVNNVSDTGAQTMPRTEGLDSSSALLGEGYAFISNRCNELETDVFETRLLLQKTLCMRGRDAAKLFYDRERFVRAGAAPKRLTRTLFGQGGVQGLDGDAHTHRKAMFMALMTPDELGRAVDLSAKQWRSYTQKWTGVGRVTLFDETMELLFRTACEWAGVPLEEDEVARRTSEMADLISSAAALGPHYLEGRLARFESERWLGALIEKTRRGEVNPPAGSALERIATHRDLNGKGLDEHVAAVELLNVVRPIVAVARYFVFCALALHVHPEWRARLREDEGMLEPFVQEVRRFYPFFPFAAARVKDTFTWRGLRFEGGTRTLLDLYGTNHDPALWDDPALFRPERFIDWQGDPYTLIPQGGGNHDFNHRCAGEWLTIRLMKHAVKTLINVSYEVPPQNLAIDLARMPALPESRFVITGVSRSAY